MHSLPGARRWTLLLLLTSVLQQGVCARSGSEPSIVGFAVNQTAKHKELQLGMSNSRINQLVATTRFNGKDKVGCEELRSKRYISDGVCYAPTPVIEVVCPAWCLKPIPPPSSIAQTPRDFSTRLRSSSSSSSYDTRRHEGGNKKNKPLMEKWRCENGATRHRKVKLLCRDGSRPIVHVRVVIDCKCTKQLRDWKPEKRRELDRWMGERLKLT